MRPGSPLAAALAAAALGASGCGQECRDLARDYAEALPAAKRCDPAASDPCSSQVPGILDQSSCPVFVDPGRAGPLDDIIFRYLSRGCRQPSPPPCPPASARCQAQDGGVGLCVP